MKGISCCNEHHVVDDESSLLFLSILLLVHPKRSLSLAYTPKIQTLLLAAATTTISQDQGSGLQHPRRWPFTLSTNHAAAISRCPALMLEAAAPDRIADALFCLGSLPNAGTGEPKTPTSFIPCPPPHLLE